MTLEPIGWLIGGLLALAGGAIAGWKRPRAAFYATAGALLCVVAGFASKVGAGAWLSGTAGEALALLALGALGCLLWQQVPRQSGWPGGAAAAGLSLLLAAALAWNVPAVSPVPQANNWLFGLRSLLAGLGLGGWLLIGAAVLQEGGRSAPARLAAWRKGSFERADDRAGDRTATLEAANAAQAGVPVNESGAAGEAGRPAAAPGPGAMLTAIGPAGWAGPGDAPAQQTASSVKDAAGMQMTEAALAALRFSYPWLTAAILAAGLWNAVAFAIPWRSRPADLWLVGAWLIGAACLHLAPRREGSRLYTALLGALALCGLASALLAALQAPTLLS